MAEKTDAQKRAQKKYMSSFVEIKVRMTPDRRTIIQEYAQGIGESVTTFINRAITETMERDTGGPQEAAGPGVVSLPPEALKTAQEAAEAAGEDVPVFVSRAVETQAQRDALGRKMEGGERK